jgi:hypothetical protein
MLSNKDLQQHRGSVYVDSQEYIAVLSNNPIARRPLKDGWLSPRRSLAAGEWGRWSASSMLPLYVYDRVR